MSNVSDSTTWVVFGVLAFVAVVAFALWLKYLPRIKAYKAKLNSLNNINLKYMQLCRERKDLVFHFYWAVDRGDGKEADMYENQVLDIDMKLDRLRTEYGLVEKGALISDPKPFTKVD
jgi:hypothetical protein